MIQKLLIVLYTLLSGSHLYAQACGQGIFTFKIFVLNEEKYTLKYDIHPISSSTAEEIERKSAAFTSAGILIENKRGELLVVADGWGSDDLNKDEAFQKLLKESGLKRSDVIKNGMLCFKTHELYDRPFILRITDGKETIYVLANLFGGCDRTSNILWNAPPAVDDYVIPRIKIE